MSDNPTTQDERVKQLVEFLDPLVDDSFKGKFNELSQLSEQELKTYTQKLEDYALVLGLAEQKQLQVGKLLGILNEMSDNDYDNIHNGNVDSNINDNLDISIIDGNNKNNNNHINGSSNTTTNTHHEL